MYNKEFIDFVENCRLHNQFVGFGNPHSKILIIGKEVSGDEGNYHKNSVDWKLMIDQKEPIFNPLHAWKGGLVKGTSNTWKNYQKLHDVIVKGSIDTDSSKVLSFQDDFFITEMNQNPERNTGIAQKKDDFKKSLNRRKEIIINHDYIRSFPVVVLACSNYIIGEEIERIFNVRFKEEEKCGNRNTFWTHYDESNKRLVIHTRQLSNNVTNDLLIKMGELIRQHLNK